MATKQSSRTTPSEMEDSEQLSESYISIGLGLLVVVVVGILLYNYFTQRNAGQTTPSPEASITEQATVSAQPGGTYTVVEGDTLWSISEKAYGTGYNWSDIAKENSLSENDQLVAGLQLKIPQVTPVALAASVTPSAVASPVAQASPVATASPVAVATPVASSSPLAAVVSPTPAASPVAQVSPAPVGGTAISGNSYTVVAGDTLWDIACRAYGDCYAWTKIANANKLENPDLIHPGNVLTLPR